MLSGGFAAQIGREQTVSLQDQRQEFSSADKDFVVFVTWAPRVRLRGQGMIQVRDGNNAVVAESKPRKLDLRAKELTLFSARLPVFATPGTYRAEVLLDGKPARYDSPTIMIGGRESYEARCRRCFHPEPVDDRT